MKSSLGRVLIADDDESARLLLAGILTSAGYDISVAATGNASIDILEREPVDLLLADLQMPGMGGLDLTRRVVSEWPGLPVIILTGNATIQSAVEAMRMGANDYLLKPIDPPTLLVRIEKGLKERALRSANARLSSHIANAGGFGEFIGINPRMREIFEIIHRVAETPTRVLVEGEPGTGKELIARAIHKQGVERLLAREPAPGRDADLEYPYIAVNCGAFSRSLLESQLFGHKKGTFTGAIADQEGVFVAARRGTLFLDEITELDLDLQVKLLRAIQEQEVTPLGATRPVPIRARVITATNRPIAELVRQGLFRSDLYYRINVVNIRVPPLRERVDDIPLLVEYFLDRTAEVYRVAPRQVTQQVLEVFQGYAWPGNVRELQNVIERAFALGRHETVITLEDLPQDLLESCQHLQAKDGQTQTRSGFPTFDHVLKDHLLRALQATSGVKKRAARLLGIDRNRLYRLMRKYEIPLE